LYQSLAHEDVLRLQIAMQNVFVVHEQQGQGHLHEVVQDLRFAHWHTATVLQELRKVATFAVAHHNAHVSLKKGGGRGRSRERTESA
jgi:hypothetical protein